MSQFQFKYSPSNEDIDFLKGNKLPDNLKEMFGLKDINIPDSPKIETVSPNKWEMRGKKHKWSIVKKENYLYIYEYLFIAKFTHKPSKNTSEVADKVNPGKRVRIVQYNLQDGIKVRVRASENLEEMALEIVLGTGKIDLGEGDYGIRFDCKTIDVITFQVELHFESTQEGNTLLNIVSNEFREQKLSLPSNINISNLTRIVLKPQPINPGQNTYYLRDLCLFKETVPRKVSPSPSAPSQQRPSFLDQKSGHLREVTSEKEQVSSSSVVNIHNIVKNGGEKITAGIVIIALITIIVWAATMYLPSFQLGESKTETPPSPPKLKIPPEVEVGEAITLALKPQQKGSKELREEWQIRYLGQSKKWKRTKSNFQIKFDRPGVHRIEAQKRYSETPKLKSDWSSYIIKVKKRERFVTLPGIQVEESILAGDHARIEVGKGKTNRGHPLEVLIEVDGKERRDWSPENCYKITFNEPGDYYVRASVRCTQHPGVKKMSQIKKIKAEAVNLDNPSGWWRRSGGHGNTRMVYGKVDKKEKVLERRWIKKMEGNTILRSADFNGDGQLEIIALTDFRSSNSRKILRVINHRGKVFQKKYVRGGPKTSVTLLNVQGDEKPEICLGYYGGNNKLYADFYEYEKDKIRKLKSITHYGEDHSEWILIFNLGDRLYFRCYTGESNLIKAPKGAYICDYKTGKKIKNHWIAGNGPKQTPWAVTDFDEFGLILFDYGTYNNVVPQKVRRIGILRGKKDYIELAKKWRSRFKNTTDQFLYNVILDFRGKEVYKKVLKHSVREYYYPTVGFLIPMIISFPQQSERPPICLLFEEKDGKYNKDKSGRSDSKILLVDPTSGAGGTQGEILSKLLFDPQKEKYMFSLSLSEKKNLNNKKLSMNLQNAWKQYNRDLGEKMLFKVVKKDKEWLLQDKNKNVKWLLRIDEKIKVYQKRIHFGAWFPASGFLGGEPKVYATLGATQKIVRVGFKKRSEIPSDYQIVMEKKGREGLGSVFAVICPIGGDSKSNLVIAIKDQRNRDRGSLRLLDENLVILSEVALRSKVDYTRGFIANPHKDGSIDIVVACQNKSKKYFIQSFELK